MSARHCLILLLGLGGVACQSRGQGPMEHHDPAAVEVRGLEREGGEGPYVAGTSETFRAVVDGDAVKSVRWSASAGALSASGERATWKLPAPGVASLSVTAITATDEERIVTYNFQVVAGDEHLGTERSALLNAPIAVLDGGSATGSFCDLTYDSSNNIHLAFRDDSHPSLWHALWNGTSWNVQFVDGMGFNVGGRAGPRFAMVVDSAGAPHFAYKLDGHVYYATKSGGSWMRERVDTTLAAETWANYDGDAVSIALNPAQSNRPTVAYVAGNAGGYRRVAVASRTGASTWSQSALTFEAAVNEHLYGDMLFDSAGTLYIPYYRSYLSPSNARLGSWNGTTAAYVNVNPGSGVTFSGFSANWANASWAGTGKIILRTKEALFQVTLATPLSSSTFTFSPVEVVGSDVGDIAYSGKPYLLHLHGNNLELVTPNTANYWTYTQMGTASDLATPSLTVNSSGTASICYQSGGKIFFQ